MSNYTDWYDLFLLHLDRENLNVFGKPREYASRALEQFFTILNEIDSEDEITFDNHLQAINAFYEFVETVENGKPNGKSLEIAVNMLKDVNLTVSPMMSHRRLAIEYMENLYTSSMNSTLCNVMRQV